MTRWAILTGEYPPQPGGVSDYTRVVARGLVAAGDVVQVYAPHTPGDDPRDDDIGVNRLASSFGPRSLAALERLLERQRPDRILVQYVPHAFGWRAMNLPFALWLALRARRFAPVWVMFHEVELEFAWRPLRHAVVGAVTRAMARFVAGAAARVFVSTPAWGDRLRRICPRAKPAEWLPVPSLVGVERDPSEVTHIRDRIASGRLVLGHFGTFGTIITTLLAPALVEVFRLVPEATVLLLGRRSDAFAKEFTAAHPEWAGRVVATGALSPADVSAHLQACDVLLQPYPDGITTRRTTAMAALAHGLPVVTNLGHLSEPPPLWTTGAVALVPQPDPVALGRLAASLLADPAARSALSARAADLYRERFALEHTIAQLQPDT